MISIILHALRTLLRDMKRSEDTSSAKKLSKVCAEFAANQHAALLRLVAMYVEMKADLEEGEANFFEKLGPDFKLKDKDGNEINRTDILLTSDSIQGIFFLFLEVSLILCLVCSVNEECRGCTALMLSKIGLGLSEVVQDVRARHLNSKSLVESETTQISDLLNELSGKI